MSFDAFWPLTLLLLLPLVWWWGRRSATNLGARHIATATALRAATLLLVTLALLRPVWHAATREISVVYVIDASRSVAPAFVQSALDWIGAADREHKPAASRYIVFGERPVVVSTLGQAANIGVTDQSGGRAGAVQRGATDLELALDQALLAFEPGQIKRLVLFSDGNQTRGDVWHVLPRLQAESVRVFAFPARSRAPSDAWIESIEVAPGVRRDEPTLVEVRVMSGSTTPAVVRLRVQDREIGRQGTRLAAGVNTLAFRVRLRQSGPVELVAEVKAQGDPIAENDRLAQSVWVGPRGRVLYAEGAAGAEGYLRDALSRDGLDVTAVSGPGLPADPAALAAYDAVVVSDVARAQLDDQRMQALAGYVRDLGGGLIYAGGETTYGQSGFSDTELERILPVEFKAQEKRKDLALVICLDRSYSMKGRPIDLAKAATRAALDLLEEQHYFGVIAFDSQPHDTVPLQQVRSKRKAEDLIDRIQASGQTNIYPALATAYRWLQNAQAKRRHVILLSDGDTAPADFERLMRRIVDAHVTVSTVAIGPAAERELMSNIANWGHGRAYYAEDVAMVPQIFVEDTQNVSRTTLVEESFRPVVKRRIEALRGVDFAAAPMLRGFASMKAREGAEVFLESDSGAPILSRWQYGLGRTVVFASDVKSRWAADWLTWEGYGRFWAQVVRDVMRRSTGADVSFSVSRDDGHAIVALEAPTREGTWQNHLAPVVRVLRPGGGEQALRLRQRAPGSYGEVVALDGFGAEPYEFHLEAGGGVSQAEARRIGSRRLYYPYPDEYRSLPPSLTVLGALAEQTGGKLTPTTEEVFAAGGDRGRTQRSLWPWLALAALLVYVLDIAVRRAPKIRHWLDRT